MVLEGLVYVGDGLAIDILANKEIRFPVSIGSVYGIYCTFVYFSNAWDYFISIRGLAYFTLGAAIRMDIFKRVYECLNKGKAVVLIMGIGMLLMKLVAWRHGSVRLGNLFDFLMVLPLMLCVWELCKYVRLPRVCAANSFSLYLMHSYFLLFSIAILVVIGARGAMDGSVVVFFMRWLFAIIVSLGTAELLRRYLPKISNVLFGGR